MGCTWGAEKDGTRVGLFLILFNPKSGDSYVAAGNKFFLVRFKSINACNGNSNRLTYV